MRSTSKILAALIITTLLSGCIALGKNKEFQPFDSTKLDKLVPGKTKAAEVTEIFGAPSEVVELANGNAYIYKRTVTKGTGARGLRAVLESAMLDLMYYLPAEGGPKEILVTDELINNPKSAFLKLEQKKRA